MIYPIFENYISLLIEFREYTGEFYIFKIYSKINISTEIRNKYFQTALITINRQFFSTHASKRHLFNKKKKKK